MQNSKENPELNETVNRILIGFNREIKTQEENAKSDKTETEIQREQLENQEKQLYEKVFNEKSVCKHEKQIWLNLINKKALSIETYSFCVKCRFRKFEKVILIKDYLPQIQKEFAILLKSEKTEQNLKRIEYLKTEIRKAQVYLNQKYSNWFWVYKREQFKKNYSL